MSSAQAIGTRSGRSLATLQEVIERLAPLDRTPCSPGEREAAEWLAQRLRAAGAHDLALESEPSWGAFQVQATALGLLGTLACALALARRPTAAVACALASTLGVIDEAQNGPRVLRRAVRRRRTTVNVVGRAGDAGAVRTLVVLAHHDAAKTGLFFDQRAMIALHRRWPQLIERGKKQPPQWWLGLLAPALAILSAPSRHRRAALAGLAFGSLITSFAYDMARSPTVPGANDNLSAVAVLVALAELLRERPLPGIRVLLVSCGAEETLQDGIRAFMARHRHEFDPAATWFLNLETVGSPHLIMVEGEGPIWMEDYCDPAFRDLAHSTAGSLGIELERGFRARASTDSVIPSRAGYPSVMLGSLTDWRLPANYHLMSDVPENLEYGTILDATRLSYALAARLGAPA
jgi:Peptidase family M28